MNTIGGVFLIGVDDNVDLLGLENDLMHFGDKKLLKGKENLITALEEKIRINNIILIKDV